MCPESAFQAPRKRTHLYHRLTHSSPSPRLLPFPPCPPPHPLLLSPPPAFPPCPPRLGVLPEELNRLLIIVVVLSMAITPALDSLGRRGAEWLETYLEEQAAAKAGSGANGALAAGRGGGGRGVGAAWGDEGYLSDSEAGDVSAARGGSGRAGHGNFEVAEPIVILGFNQMGQVS